MNILLERLDQIRRTVFPELAGFCDALVSLFESIQAAANTWAAVDHNSDGTHLVVRLGGTTAQPEAREGRISIYVDGTDLKIVRPDGTVGTITVV